MLSLDEGVQRLSNEKQAFRDWLIEEWNSKENDEYVKTLEGQFTTLLDQQGSLPIYAPTHLYGQLSQCVSGCAVLTATVSIPALLDTMRDESKAVSRQKRAAALWAIVSCCLLLALLL